VLGDLHGCYSCLKAAIHQSNFMEKVRRFKADPEHNPDVRLVLLGDYIDRGRFSYNGVLRTILNLYLTVPEHVVVLRGNHEYYIEYQGKVYGGVRPAEAINSMSEPAAGRGVHPLPRLLRGHAEHAALRPAAVRARRHPPRQPDRREVEGPLGPQPRGHPLPDAVERPQQGRDGPRRAAEGQRPLRLRPPAVSQASWARSAANVLIRGHEKVNSGFRSQWNDEDFRLFTLFSAGGADNDDLPEDSNYREVRPMALTITSRDGVVAATPWAIDYKRYQDPKLNNFFDTALEIDISPQH
jgi:hypothetical protein